MHKMLVIVTVAAAALSRPAAAEPVEFRAGETTLKAMLYRPAGAGPFPAIVALHGCDGLGPGGGAVDPHYAEWAERLVAGGFAVLFPDSFASRGLYSQCGVRERTVRASRLRTADANAARYWLQSQPWIVADRISLLGWSHGATTALWTVRRGGKQRDKAADFRSMIAFYPNCRRSGASAWSARVPTLVLIGARDDWSPAPVCQQMAAAARWRSAAVSVVVYPGAYQDFDRANLALQERTGIANTANASGRVHIGGDATARADAIRRVAEWLAR